MSQKIENWTGEQGELVFDSNYLSHLEGKLLTFIETLGFEAKREASIKSLISSSIWVDAHNGWATPVISEDWRKFKASQIK